MLMLVNNFIVSIVSWILNKASNLKLIVFYVLFEVVKVAIMNITGYGFSVIEGNRGDVISPAV